jgi:transposase
MKVENKKKKPQLSYWQSCQLRALVQFGNVPVAQILKNQTKFPGFAKFSRATIYRHSRKPLDGLDPHDKRTLNKGRPPLLDERDYRYVKRQVQVLREFEGTFSSVRLQSSCTSLNDGSVSNSTFRRALRKLGYRYRQTRRKGMLTQGDLSKRLKFARRVKRLKLGREFWQKGISFYLDATGFVYKSNPLDQARTPSAREWRLSGEGLKFRCTTKGKKEGTKQAKFMVAISHDHGVVLCHQLHEKLNGVKMAKMIHRHFPLAFTLSVNPKSKRLLQDGCPVQNSRKAKRALERIGAHLFCIPARSPDMNPIENLFNQIGKELRQQAIDKKITHETFEEFSQRVTKTLQEYPAVRINKIIESMDKRMDAIIAAKGQRIKY